MSGLLALLLCIAAAQPGEASPARWRGERAVIIDLTKGAGHALLVGGWNGKQWVRDEKYHRAVYGGEIYRFYGFAAKAGEAAGGKALLSEASGSAWQIEIKRPPVSGESLIGMTGAWNALPRKPQIVREAAPFRGLVASVLKQRGFGKSPLLITRVIRVDLDGDGKAEEIISATCPRLARDAGEATMRAEKGDYSFVLVRSRAGGRTVVTVLPGAYWYEPESTTVINEIAGALDLNGDGKLEMVVRTNYYEGGGVRVYELSFGLPREVLAAIDGA